MQQHFVTFYSPGTFVAETTQKPIDSWDVDRAAQMAKGITERYGAKPYGFVFSTRARGDDELDSKVVSKSPFYYLSGKIETIEEIRKRNDPKERILLSNMEINGYEKVIRMTDGWAWSQPLEKDDVVLNQE